MQVMHLVWGGIGRVLATRPDGHRQQVFCPCFLHLGAAAASPYWWSEDTLNALDNLGRQLRRLLRTTDIMVTGYLPDVWRANDAKSREDRQQYTEDYCNGSVAKVDNPSHKCGSRGWVVTMQPCAGGCPVTVPLARAVLHGWKWCM